MSAPAVRDIGPNTLLLFRFVQQDRNSPMESFSKNYGPRDAKAVYRSHGRRNECSVCLTNEAGEELSPWFPISDLRARLTSEGANPRQLAELDECGVAYDPATIDRQTAAELLSAYHDAQPADEEMIAEAREDYGLTPAEGISAGELDAAMERVQQERDRVEQNAEEIQRLKKLGYDLAPDVSDEELLPLVELIEDFESAISDAREWGLPARVVPKLPLDGAALRKETSALRIWEGIVKDIDNEQLGYRFDRRPPAQKRVKAALVSYYEGLRADQFERSAEPEAVIMGLIEVIEAADGVAVKKAPAPARQRSAPRPPPTAVEPTSRRDLFVGVVVLLVLALIIGAAVS